jgi:hypothetical protein
MSPVVDVLGPLRPAAPHEAIDEPSRGAGVHPGQFRQFSVVPGFFVQKLQREALRDGHGSTTDRVSLEVRELTVYGEQGVNEAWIHGFRARTR